MADGFDTPVVLFVFNRPALTADAMARLENIRPSRLFIVADGPRHSEEEALCRATRQAVRDGITWSCSVEYLESDTNLGCRTRIETGLDWLFERVDRAIVLEDDIAASDDFFVFAAGALEQHSADGRIRMISGRNVCGRFPEEPTAFLSRSGAIWGWATWADRWQAYRRGFANADSETLAAAIVRHSQSPLQASLQSYLFETRMWQRIDTWDMSWCIWIRADDGYVLTAPRNLVVNLGMNADATHTRSADDFRNLLPILNWPECGADNANPPINAAYDLQNGLSDLLPSLDKPRRWKVLAKQRGIGAGAERPPDGWDVMLLPFSCPQETFAFIDRLRQWVDSPHLDELAEVFAPQ